MKKVFRISGTTVDLLCGLLFVLYAIAFYDSVAQFWFSPAWTTDDAVQQIYPFYKALDPQLFQDDLVTLMMEQYLPPLHYALCWGLTRLLGDPIMMGHWVMLLKLVLLLGFVFSAVRVAAGTAPAFLAMTWMLHTRHIIQRLTGGLPRGWAAPLLAAWIYLVLKGNQRAVMLLIFVGCLLHPPATLLMAAAYGLLLLWQLIAARGDAAAVRRLLWFMAASPIYLVAVLAVVQMPEQIGTMASYSVAASMPEFSHPDGRFPFVPLQSVGQDLYIFGYQAFINFLQKVTAFDRNWRRAIQYVVLALFLAAIWMGIRRTRVTVPAALWCYLIATAGVYAASRVLAFRLYVPNRHLQFPLAIFFVCTVTIALWRAFHRYGQGASAVTENSWHDTSWSSSRGSLLALSFLAGVIWLGSSTGLQGDANFNYPRNSRGGVFEWIRVHTPKDALIAGEPTFIDPCQLFAVRRAYISTESAHPFYDRYYAEVRRRLTITLKAHYAKDLVELVRLLEPEGVDYFVFARAKFYPEALAKAKYFKPFDTLVRELTSRPPDEYAYRQLPRVVTLADFPAMPYKDEKAALVHIPTLKQWLQSKARWEQPTAAGL